MTEEDEYGGKESKQRWRGDVVCVERDSRRNGKIRCGKQGNI